MTTEVECIRTKTGNQFSSIVQVEEFNFTQPLNKIIILHRSHSVVPCISLNSHAYFHLKSSNTSVDISRQINRKGFPQKNELGMKGQERSDRKKRGKNYLDLK